jgi:hypothetical protein
MKFFMRSQRTIEIIEAHNDLLREPNAKSGRLMTGKGLLLIN